MNVFFGRVKWQDVMILVSGNTREKFLYTEEQFWYDSYVYICSNRCFGCGIPLRRASRHYAKYWLVANDKF